MTPDITKFLTDGVEVPRTDKTHWENLIPLLDESLCTLNNELNDEHFQLILEILVERIFAITFDVVDKNIEVSASDDILYNLLDFLANELVTINSNAYTFLLEKETAAIF